MVTLKSALSRMSEHILDANYQATTRDFCELVREGAPPMSVGMEAMRVVSPFLHVPSHIMVKPDGDQRTVNFDHVILALWRSKRMSQFMPKGYAELPLTQAIWYLPQGLDIWSQILCEFPGHYAREQERCPEIKLKGPVQRFDECPPIKGGSFEDRIALMLHSIVEGDKATAFQAFLGAAAEATQDEVKRRDLEASVLFAGITDMPGPRLVMPNMVNAAHKAIRARAMVDLANVVGWENSYPLFLAVIPDLATHPRYFDLLETATAELQGRFGREYRELRHTNQAPLNAREIEGFVRVLLNGSQEDTFAAVTDMLAAGKSLIAINDAAVLGAGRVIVQIERPGLSSGFSQATHCFDYSNVVGYWLRTYDHPQQVKAAYFAPHFVNESARLLRRVPSLAEEEFETQPHEHARFAESQSLGGLLRALSTAIDAQEAPLATALTDSYLSRSRNRKRLIATLAFASAKWEGDPHMPRNAMSHHEEYSHTTLPGPLRDEIFRSWTRYVSRVRKRSYDFNCFELYKEVLT